MHWASALFLLISTSMGCCTYAEFLVTKDSITTSANETVEYLWSQPKGNGPWPVLVLIHPHQEWPNKIGAEIFEKNKSLQIWASKGFITIAVSQPGYGKSQGPADYCGPRSQLAVVSVIEHFRKLPITIKEKFFLYGGSRGAVVASMIATQDTQLAGIILKSGIYDLSSAYRSYPWYSMIKLNIIWELGFFNDTKLRDRSAINFVDRIHSPMLIIHGSNDDRASLEGAKLFVEAAKEKGLSVNLKILNSEHVIPMSIIQGDMEAFMKKYLP
jgi:dipeptidyl aminopeptidase/acylaminoacyl peptidase